MTYPALGATNQIEAATEAAPAGANPALWAELQDLNQQAEEKLEALGKLDADQVTTEMQAEIDELYAKAAAVRAKIDRGRAAAVGAAVGGLAGGALAGFPGITAEQLFGGAQGPAGPIYQGAMAEVMAGRAGGWIQAAMGGALSGPAREVSEQLFGGELAGPHGVHVPWMTERVDASRTTTWPSQLIGPRVFDPVYPLSEAMRTLGVMSTPVPIGEQRFAWQRPISADAVAEGIAATITDINADPITIKPGRAVVATPITDEIAYSEPGIEASIVSNLAAALADQIEQKVIATLSTGTAPARADVDTFQSAAALFGGQVDGRFAADVEDLALLTNSAVYSHLASLFVSSSGQASALDILREQGRRVAVSAHMPAAADGLSKVIYRRGRRGDAAVLAIWNSFQLSSVLDTRTASYGSGRILVGAAMYGFAIAPSMTGTANETRGDFVLGSYRNAAAGG